MTRTVTILNPTGFHARPARAFVDKATAEFALALMLTSTSKTWPNEHMHRAVMAAQEGSLLAKNLLRFYPKQSLAEAKRAAASQSASR